MMRKSNLVCITMVNKMWVQHSQPTQFRYKTRALAVSKKYFPLKRQPPRLSLFLSSRAVFASFSIRDLYEQTIAMGSAFQGS